MPQEKELAELARIGDLVRRGAVRFAGRPAVFDGPLRWTYRDLLGAIEGARVALAGLGVGPGDRVLVVQENCAETIALLFAASELDAWPVIVSARLAAHEVDRILDHCRPQAALFLSRRSEAARAHAARSGAREGALGPLGAAQIWTPPTAPPRETPDPRVDRRVAAMIYTSGTTGAPKGAMLSHRNLLFIGRTQAAVRRYTPDDKLYCVLPIAHIGALSSILMGLFHAGGSLILDQRFSPAEIGRVLREEGVTILPGVPTSHVRFAEWARANPSLYAAPKLRMVTCASSPLDPAVKADVEAVYGLPLQNGYGLTETGAVVCQTSIDEPRRDTSVGKPLPGVEVRFADNEGRDVRAGEVGEILVRGPNVFLGYYRAPEATKAVFTADGWFRTGDLGYMDLSGDVFIAGRLKDIIKRSGYNVYPIDVETALNAHPSVAICAVIGRPRGADEEVVAFIQPREGVAVERDEVIAFLAQRLASYKLPNVLEVVPLLPVLHNGKVDKAVMRRMADELPRR